MREKDFIENAGNISEDEKVLVYDENNNFRAIYQKKGKEFRYSECFKNIFMLKNIPMF